MSTISALAAGDITQKARAFLQEHGATIKYAGTSNIEIISFPAGTQANKGSSYWDYSVELPGIEQQEGEDEGWFTLIIVVELDIDSSETKVKLEKY